MTLPFKKLLRPIVPRFVRDRIRQHEVRHARLRFGKMPRAQAFATIYREGHWGKWGDKPFDSGEGSTDECADQYCQLIEDYIRDNHITRVVDLGCGDFTIGARIAKLVNSYRGVDIVPELIEYNTRAFGSRQVTFECIDVVEQAPPPAQLCLVRQVLQHLSNAEIKTVLGRLSVYAHVIVTEHVPAGHVADPNKDKPHGPDHRLYDGSGVFLNEPPFSCDVAKMWKLPYKEGEILLATLMRNSGENAFLTG